MTRIFGESSRSTSGLRKWKRSVSSECPSSIRLGSQTRPRWRPPCPAAIVHILPLCTLALILHGCAAGRIARQPAGSSEYSATDVIPSASESQRLVESRAEREAWFYPSDHVMFFDGPREYSSRAGALSWGVLDGVSGGLFGGILTGGVAALLSKHDKGDAFWKWSAIGAGVIVPVWIIDNITAVKSKTLVAYHGDWVDPHVANLVKRDGNWLDQEETAWADACAIDTPEAIERFLLQFPAGSLRSVASDRLERQLWNRTLLSPRLEDWEMFLRRFPEGRHSAEAGERIEWLAWVTARESDTRAGYGAYLKRFPSGSHAVEASGQMRALESASGEDRPKASSMESPPADASIQPDAEAGTPSRTPASGSAPDEPVDAAMAIARCDRYDGKEMERQFSARGLEGRRCIPITRAQASRLLHSPGGAQLAVTTIHRWTTPVVVEGFDNEGVKAYSIGAMVAEQTGSNVTKALVPMGPGTIFIVIGEVKLLGHKIKAERSAPLIFVVHRAIASDDAQAEWDTEGGLAPIKFAFDDTINPKPENATGLAHPQQLYLQLVYIEGKGSAVLEGGETVRFP